MRFIDIILHEFRIDMPADGEGMGIPRKKMPQIKTKDYPEYFQYLKDNGVDFQKLDGVKAATLKPTQSEFSKQGVEKQLQKMWDKNDDDKPLIASSDDYIIDGHHRWLVAKNTRRPLTIFKADVPMKELMALTLKFPKVYFKDIYNEGYKLQLERDADMYVLHITDSDTGKRTEVRGKSGYESGNYDADDKLHQLLDRIGKAANISELINGEVVGINPKHPDGANAKTHADKAFNESKNGLPVKTLKGLFHVGTLDASKKRDGFEGAGLSVSTHPDAWKRIAKGHVTGDTYSATKEGNRFLDAHSLTKEHNAEITQWAIKNGYLEQQETVTVCYYDDEMEDDLCQTFDSMADAEAEYDDELEFMDVTVDKGGIVPTDKLKKETRQTRMSATGVLEFVLPIFAEQQGLDGVWWQDTLDVQRYSAPRGVIVPSKIKSWKFTVNETTAFNESLDNPYPFNLKGPDESQSFVATAQTPNGPLRMEFSSTDFDDFGIDFSIGKSMGKTDAGDEFRVFATVVAMMKKWISTVGIEHVEGFDFGADKTDHASDGRARLYTRFAKQLASKLGWKLEQSTTGNGSTSFFRLTNPKPVPRDDKYWDALDEEVEVSLHGDAKKGYVLSKIEVSGDERNAGQGTKAMQDIVDRMDREGAIIALTPDDAFGGNKNRLIKFYKRFGFVPNKGRNKDFRFRETMIRYPQSNEGVSEAAGVGRVVKGVNTTVDVGPDEIIKQVKKYGNDVDRDGFPKKHLR